jgi:hypothetical protein
MKTPIHLKVTAFRMNVKILPEIFLWPEAAFWSIVFALLRFVENLSDKR